MQRIKSYKASIFMDAFDGEVCVEGFPPLGRLITYSVGRFLRVTASH